MAIGLPFKSETKDLLERIRTKAWSTPEERQVALQELAASPSVKLTDAMPLLFTPEADMRRAVGALLASRRDPKTLEVFLATSKGKPEAARRAALAVLTSLQLGDLPGQLGQLAAHQDAQVRRVATEALLDLPLTQETVPHLVRIIEQGEASHRVRAVSRFAEVATDKHLSFFERLLDDPDEKLRLAAWQVVIKHAEPKHLDLFIRRVPDEPHGTQQVLVAALQALVPKAGPAAVDQVLGLLSSGNTALRTAAIRILMGVPDRVAVVRRFIDHSRQLLGWVRDRALESMREFGPALIGPAAELASDPDPRVRSAALALVASFDDPKVGEVAAALVADPDWWIAINAADVLGRLKDQKHVPVLVGALAREEVRWAAAESLGRIGGPQALQALAGLTRDARPEIRIEALVALAASEDSRVVPLFQQVAASDPVKWVRVRAGDLAQALARKKSIAMDEQALRAAIGAATVAQGAPEVHALLALARREGASDLHVSVDAVPALRVPGQLKRLAGEPLTAAATEALLLPLLTPDQAARLREARQVDACFHVENDGRYRGNLFVDRKGLNAVFRVIPEQPPSILDLGLPHDLTDITMIHQGIIIVTGPAGCGKSTTLAALVNLINETRRSHVLTLEDPVEFVHPFKNSLVNQREVGRHTSSFAQALRAALRENPDVIVIGEMRDPETVSLALTASETGHVVLATLNATSAAKAVDRIVTSFPVDEQGQIRESFAESLKIIIAQSLLPAAKGGRVACYEILRGTRAIGSLIRDGKTFQIPSLMQIGQAQGMRTFDDALMELVRSGKVTPETAYLRAGNKELFQPLVSPKFLEEAMA